MPRVCMRAQVSATPNRELIDKLGKEKAELTQNLRHTEANVAFIQHEAESAKKQAVDMGKQLEARGTELRGALGREAEAKEDQAAVELAMKKMQAEAEEAQRHIEKLNEAVQSAQSKLSTAEGAYNSLQKESFELEKQVYGLRADLKATENTIPPAVRSRLDGLDADVHKLRKELKEEKAKFASLSNDFDMSESRRKAAVENAAAAESARSAAEKEAESARAKLDIQRGQFEKEAQKATATMAAAEEKAAKEVHRATAAVAAAEEKAAKEAQKAAAAEALASSQSDKLVKAASDAAAAQADATTAKADATAAAAESAKASAKAASSVVAASALGPGADLGDAQVQIEAAIAAAEGAMLTRVRESVDGVERRLGNVMSMLTAHVKVKAAASAGGRSQQHTADRSQQHTADREAEFDAQQHAVGSKKVDGGEPTLRSDAGVQTDALPARELMREGSYDEEDQAYRTMFADHSNTKRVAGGEGDDDEVPSGGLSVARKGSTSDSAMGQMMSGRGNKPGSRGSGSASPLVGVDENAPDKPGAALEGASATFDLRDKAMGEAGAAEQATDSRKSSRSRTPQGGRVSTGPTDKMLELRGRAEKAEADLDTLRGEHAACIKAANRDRFLLRHFAVSMMHHRGIEMEDGNVRLQGAQDELAQTQRSLDDAKTTPAQAAMVAAPTAVNEATTRYDVNGNVFTEARSTIKNTVGTPQGHSREPSPVPERPPMKLQMPTAPVVEPEPVSVSDPFATNPVVTNPPGATPQTNDTVTFEEVRQAGVADAQEPRRKRVAGMEPQASKAIADAEAQQAGQTQEVVTMNALDMEPQATVAMADVEAQRAALCAREDAVAAQEASVNAKEEVLTLKEELVAAREAALAKSEGSTPGQPSSAEAKKLQNQTQSAEANAELQKKVAAAESRANKLASEAADAETASQSSRSATQGSRAASPKEPVRAAGANEAIVKEVIVKEVVMKEVIREVIKEVPVEKIVYRDVVREVPIGHAMGVGAQYADLGMPQPLMAPPTSPEPSPTPMPRLANVDEDVEAADRVLDGRRDAVGRSRDPVSLVAPPHAIPRRPSLTTQRHPLGGHALGRPSTLGADAQSTGSEPSDVHARMEKAMEQAWAAKEAAAAANESARASQGRAQGHQEEIRKLSEAVSTLTNENLGHTRVIEELKAQLDAARMDVMDVTERAATPGKSRGDAKAAKPRGGKLRRGAGDKKGFGRERFDASTVEGEATIAATLATASAYGIDPALLHRIQTDMAVVEAAVPLSSFSQEHTQRVIASATAAVLAMEGGVTMPPAPPSCARAGAVPDSVTSHAIRAAAEAAYELQCASPSRGSSRSGSRLPDFYRAWMEQQLEQHGAVPSAQDAANTASMRAVGFPYNRCPPFLARPESSPGIVAAIYGTPPARNRNVRTASPRARYLPGKEPVPPKASPVRHQQPSAKLAPGAPPPSDGGLRPSMPPWSPPCSTLQTSASAPFLGVREHIAPMVASLTGHTDEGVRRVGQQILEQLAHVGALGGDGSDFPWQPKYLDADALASAGGPPSAMRAAAQQKDEGARRRNASRALTPVQPPSGRLANDYAVQAATRRQTSAPRMALGPVVPVGPPELASSAAALTRALAVFGKDLLPLHAIGPVVSKLFDSNDPSVKDAGSAFVRALMRSHGDQVILDGPVSKVLGTQTIAALRRAQSPSSKSRPETPSAPLDAAVLVATVDPLGPVLATFGPQVINLPLLHEHADHTVREAASRAVEQWRELQRQAREGALAASLPGTPSGGAKQRATGGKGLPTSDLSLTGSGRAVSFNAGGTALSSPVHQQRVAAAPPTPLPTGAATASVVYNNTPNASPLPRRTKDLAKKTPALDSTADAEVARALLSDPPVSPEQGGVVSTGLAMASSPSRDDTNPDFEMSGTTIAFSPGDVRRSKPHVLPAPQTIPLPYPNAPMDASWRVENPSMTTSEHEELLQTFAIGGAGPPRGQLEYLNLAQRVEYPCQSSGRQGLQPSGSTPTIEQGAAVAALRPSVSAGHLGFGEVPAVGANPYLDRLPPVLRRSVCGPGPRPPASPGWSESALSAATVVIAPELPPPVPKPPSAELLAKVYAL